MKPKSKGMSYAKWGYIFLAPFFITFFIFQFWPLATTIYYSFFEYFRSGLKIIGPNFVGLKNYAAMIKEVPKYFSNTMIMWLMGFIPQIIVSLVLAAWFTDLRLKLRFQGFFKRGGLYNCFKFQIQRVVGALHKAQMIARHSRSSLTRTPGRAGSSRCVVYYAMAVPSAWSLQTC